MRELQMAGMLVFVGMAVVYAEDVPQQELIADDQPNLFDRQNINGKQTYNQNSYGNSGNYYSNQNSGNGSSSYYYTSPAQQPGVPMRSRSDAAYYNYDDATPGR